MPVVVQLTMFRRRFFPYWHLVTFILPKCLCLQFSHKITISRSVLFLCFTYCDWATKIWEISKHLKHYLESDKWVNWSELNQLCCVKWRCHAVSLYLQSWSCSQTETHLVRFSSANHLLVVCLMFALYVYSLCSFVVTVCQQGCSCKCMTESRLH